MVAVNDIGNRIRRAEAEGIDWASCTCHFDCRQDSHSGTWHQHEGDPCPITEHVR